MFPYVRKKGTLAVKPKGNTAGSIKSRRATVYQKHNFQQKTKVKVLEMSPAQCIVFEN